MKRFAYIGTLMMLFHTDQLLAQDSLLLREIPVFADRFSMYSAGQKTTTLDSSQLVFNRNRNLQDILAEQSQVFIKNYGPGNISTPSFRGTGAEHTAFVWNGFNLQSPMLGQIDFSLLPFNAGDELLVHHGGNGALYGSGAIGGAIHLNSKPQFKRASEISLGFQMGSEGRYTEQLHSNFTKGNFNWSNNIQIQQAENNFKFNNPSLPGNPEQRLSHASTKQQLLTSDAWYKNKSTLYGLHLWLQNNHRNIPAGLSSATGTSTQDDQSAKLAFDLKNSNGIHDYSFRTALIYDGFTYTDTLRNTNSINHSWMQVIEVEDQMKLHQQWNFGYGINNTWSTADAATYKNVTLNRTAAYVIMKFKSPTANITANAGLRAEYMNNTLLPVMPETGIKIKLPWHSTWSASVSRSYRIPTFNERFWNPGGNPNLKPEQGWGGESTLEHQFKNQVLETQFLITAFQRSVKDWIQWIPDSSYWKPFNITQVNTYGIESQAKVIIHLSRLTSVKASVAMNFQRSHMSVAGNLHQLPYIPRITHQYAVTLKRKNWNLMYQFNYTGLRYINNDNSNALDAYRLAQLRTNWSHQIHSVRYNFFAEITNLFNTFYTVYPDRVMPSRQFSAGLYLTI